MVNPQLVEETPMSLTEIKVELGKIKKRDKELGARSLRMEEYLNQFTTLSSEEHKKLVDELTKLDIPRLRDIHILKIADMIPETVDDIKVILQGYALTVTNDNMKKIVGVTSKFTTK